MRCGLVASSTFDIISFKDSVTPKIKKYASEVIDKIPPHFVRSYGLLGARDDYDELSDSDIELLDFSVEKFGVYSSKKLVSITHEYIEWAKFANDLANKDTSYAMDMSDFFAQTTNKTNEYDIIPADVVKANKEIYLSSPLDR